MIDTATYLGPATVTRTLGRPGFVEVQLPRSELTWARLAFALPYAPCEGDELLVIRQEESLTYAVGVLRNAAATVLRIPGDLSIEAEGTIRIESPRTVALRSKDRLEAQAPEVVLRAGRLELVARRAIQRFHDAYFWLRGLFQVKSGRLRAVADEDLFLKSGRTHMKSEDDFSIDGRTIHLG